MADFLWRRCDQISKPVYINLDDDICFYAREYIGHGYQGSPSNQLISNFKIEPSYRGGPRWYYKTRAIQQFALELKSLFNHGVCIIPAPTSHSINDPDYDSRIVDTIHLLIEDRPDIRCENILDVVQKIPSAHGEEGPRNPNVLKHYFRVLDPSAPLPSQVVIVDDVVTTGGHFKACKALLQEKYPTTQIIGVFWALRRFDDESLTIEDL